MKRNESNRVRERDRTKRKRPEADRRRLEPERVYLPSDLVSPVCTLRGTGVEKRARSTFMRRRSPGYSITRREKSL